ncbi:MAG: helix-turn-helix domain-containing protein [Rectinemataceae bacterium]
MIDPNMLPDWVSPPGDTILDALEEKGWTQAELAERTGYTRKHINQLTQGKAPINEETALKLERVLGSSAGFWLNREAQYRELLARRSELEDLKSSVPWLSELPLADMVMFGWIQKHGNRALQVAECLRYFGVANVKAWREKYQALVLAYRASEKVVKEHGAVVAWLRWGERQSETLVCQPYDKSILGNNFDAMRQLTLEADSQVFLPVLTRLCAASGVALAVAPAPKGCPVSGLTRWLQPDKALVMFSLRYKTNDQFWFTFFHELAHLLLHGKRMLFLEGLPDGLPNQAEIEANQWAGTFLIPKASEMKLAMLGQDEAAIRRFAQELGIAPGIVVGRLQKEGLLPWASGLNHIKVLYEWVEKRQ